MRKTKLNIVAGILTFTTGVLGTTLWFIYPSLVNQTLHIIPFVKSESEMNEEYAVYSVILNDLFVKDKDRNYQSLSAISDQTIPFYFPNTEILSSIQEETISDFEMKHSKSYKLYPRFNLSINYTLINTEKPEDHDLRRAIIYLSNVGFDKEKTQAVVYIDYKCGLCGFGMYLILEKENGLWKIKQTNKLWAS